MNRNIIIHRLARPLALAVAGLVLAATGALADTPMGHSGTYGRHYLADSEEFAGAVCHYDGSQNLDRVKVYDPFVFAFSNDQDMRAVSWRVIVQQRIGSGAWTEIGRSSQQFSEARTSRPADFAPISVNVSANSAATVRALVKMSWWVGGKSINRVGGATHRVDWYRYPLADANPGFCPAAIL